MEIVMNQMKSWALRCRSFASDTRGTVTIESLIALPLLMFWYIASFTFFDAFRVINTSTKGTYVLAEIVSRTGSAQVINQIYIDGMNQLFQYIVKGQGASWVRFTSVKFDDNGTASTSDDKYVLHWSHATGTGNTTLTEGDLNSVTVKARLPNMHKNESAIVVETFLTYTPPFNIGLPTDLVFTNFVFTSPRFDRDGVNWSS